MLLYVLVVILKHIITSIKLIYVINVLVSQLKHIITSIKLVSQLKRIITSIKFSVAIAGICLKDSYLCQYS
jgi:hypothetical protein